MADVEAHLARNEARTKEQVQAAIAAARPNLARWNASTITASEARRWKRWSHGRPHHKYSADAECPACQATGAVASDYEDDREIIWPDNSDDEPYMEVTFTPDYFSCPVCHSILFDHEQLLEAGLGDPIVIADLHRAGRSMRSIAAELNRSPGTMSRELDRNTDPGTAEYRPHAAQRQAQARRLRPRKGKLARDPVLREYVQTCFEKSAPCPRGSAVP